jgi:hypothetical protein
MYKGTGVTTVHSSGGRSKGAFIKKNILKSPSPIRLGRMGEGFRVRAVGEGEDCNSPDQFQSVIPAKAGIHPPKS